MYAVIDITVLWAMIGLMAVAVGLEWSVCRTPNFAIADLTLFSLFMGEAVFGFGLPGLLLACLCNLFLRLAVWRFVFDKLRRSNAGENLRIATSLGISLLTVAINGLVLGTNPMRRAILMSDRDITVLGATLDLGRLEIVLSSVIVLGLFAVYVRTKGAGRSLALFASNLDLASRSGLLSKGIYYIAIFWSSLLAFCAIRVLATTQLLAPHDGGLIMAFALAVAFIGRSRVGRTTMAAGGFAVLAYLAGDMLNVDVGRAAGLMASALAACMLDRANPFRQERAG